jgi:hypothetical protein
MEICNTRFFPSLTGLALASNKPTLRWPAEAWDFKSRYGMAVPTPSLAFPAPQPLSSPTRLLGSAELPDPDCEIPQARFASWIFRSPSPLILPILCIIVSTTSIFLRFPPPGMFRSRGNQALEAKLSVPAVRNTWPHALHCCWSHQDIHQSLTYS